MLEIIIITLIISSFLNIILKKIELPTIIWNIITWFVIAYIFWLHDASTNGHLMHIAEFGIVFLMFTIWLEFSFSEFMKMKKQVFLYWSLQFFISSIIFTSISYFLFSLDLISSSIIWLALALSSTAIVLKILNENNDIIQSHGQKSLGILLFQDLAVIPIMILISILSISDSSVVELVWKTVLWWAILIVSFLLIWKYLLEYILTRVSKTASNEIFISSILAFVLASSYLAHYLGLSFSLWALIAGIMIAETHFKHRVESDLIPFRDLLLGFFFITVWMQLELRIIYENLYMILAILLAIIVIKVLIIFWILQFFTKKIIALRTAITLFQVWEFAIVVFELAWSKWLLDKDISQVLIVVIIISMILTPIVMKKLEYIVGIFLKDTFNPENKILDEKLENHIILIGYWKIWKRISNQLKSENEKYYILEDDIMKFKSAKKEWKPVFYWDATKATILNLLNIDKTKSVLITIRDSKNLYKVCDIVSQIVPKSKIYIKVNSYEQRHRIEKLNFTNIIYETQEIANGMIREMKKN